MTLEQEFKEKVGFDAYENNQMQPKVYNESYVEWLEAKINYTRCCITFYCVAKEHYPELVGDGLCKKQCKRCRKLEQ